MKFVFYSEPTFETWDWRNPDVKGIGGSETSHIEMAARLARRGHEVISFAPVSFEGTRVGPGGEIWGHSIQFGGFVPTADAYVIYRAPHVVDQLPEGSNAWLICQDVDYLRKGSEITEERASKFTRIVALCKRHADFLESRYPFAANKIVQSSNGIKRDLIERIEKEGIVRNPKRLMYASSPDRGMEYLLDVFPRAKEIVPDLELHIYYGFDNIEKLVEKYGQNHWISRNTQRLKSITEQPGVTVHGRTNQPDLIREWFKAGIWCHPSNFTETSCITCMDAQACGAIPITSPLWAVAENVRHGVFIDGDVRSDLVRSRFAFELAKMAALPKLQDAIREDMMESARERFDWELFVSQWERWAQIDKNAQIGGQGLAEMLPQAVSA